MIRDAMFFIVPGPMDQSTSPTAIEVTSADQAAEPSTKRRRVTGNDTEGSGIVPEIHRRRTARACDRCRMKKAKCSGGNMCGKCRRDGVVCVTTLAPRKDDHTHRPGYVNLIESQRDQLARALQKVLEVRETSALAEVKTLLADMGVAIDNFDFANRLLNCDHGPSPAGTISPMQTASPPWDDVFNNLDDPQLEAMESFSSVMAPPLPGLSFDMSFGSSNSEDSPLAEFTNQFSETPSSLLEPTGSLQMYDSEGGTMSLNAFPNGETGFDSTTHSQKATFHSEFDCFSAWSTSD